MRVSVVTIFPGWFGAPLDVSVVGRAIANGALQVDLIDLRGYGLGRHRQVDDTPFGGGPGMVMMIEPIDHALAGLVDAHKVLFSPAGARLDQATLDRWAGLDHVALVCGRYEGVDQRVADNLVDEEVSMGDFVLAGGEVAAMAVIEAVARLLPGVVGNPVSTETESFRSGLLEEPQYTRPAEYRGWAVPEVLLSGDHGRIERWREQQRIDRTAQRRPDLGRPDLGRPDLASRRNGTS
ncbi:MAG TPA: tRNA (guanosine(37)-N1)-methyltransferase TrmD [Acidimicrobiia bacterium]|nr:tRNA (guanosine(37)-N1)-methyltransferase TrmD [Acidimicrobiia bacterium]